MTFAPLVVTINTTSDGNGSEQVASIKQGSAVPDGIILYGLQTPFLEFEPMELVLDLDLQAYGPAFHFSANYNKLVILQPDQLSASSGFAKRDETGSRQRFQVEAGDYPWYCFWNNTYIEGYIYAEDNSSAASVTALPTQLATKSLGPTSLTSSASGDVTAAAATVSSSAQTSNTQAAQTAQAAQPAATAASAARRDATTDPADSPRMQSYPRIVKIEERRLPNSPQPYCQQMFLLDNGQITIAPNGDDGPIRVLLDEQDPTFDEYLSVQPTQTADVQVANNKRGTARQKQRRSDPSNACHCQWMFK